MTQHLGAQFLQTELRHVPLIDQHCSVRVCPGDATILVACRDAQSGRHMDGIIKGESKKHWAEMSQQEDRSKTDISI